MADPQDLPPTTKRETSAEIQARDRALNATAPPGPARLPQPPRIPNPVKQGQAKSLASDLSYMSSRNYTANQRQMAQKAAADFRSGRIDYDTASGLMSDARFSRSKTASQRGALREASLLRAGAGTQTQRATQADTIRNSPEAVMRDFEKMCREKRDEYAGSLGDIPANRDDYTTDAAKENIDPETGLYKGEANYYRALLKSRA